MPLSRKFLTKSTDKKIVKIGQYLARKKEHIIDSICLYSNSAQLKL